jgi:16S rRNA (adenine1518-N6/adenine1519-N6)-dimethyltransferase
VTTSARLPWPRKRFGQHFLERAWVEKLVRLIDPRADQIFLEIGPGRGALTVPLAARARHVLAVEIDRDLAKAVAAIGPANLTVVEADVLDITPERLHRSLVDLGIPDAPAVPLRVVGNLPYNVASPIVFRLIELYRAGIRIDDVTVMLQREVARRLLSPPGSGDYGVLSVLVRHAADVEHLLALPPGAFRPPPAVDSTVVRLRPHPDAPAVKDRALFERLVQAVFTRRRKTLENALLAFRPDGKTAIRAALAESGIDGTRRPESLEIAEFVRLANSFVT